MAVGKNVIFSATVGDTCPEQEQAVIKAAEVVVPGATLLLDSNGEFIDHDSAGEAKDFFVANLNAEAQESVSDAWAAGDTCTAFIPQAGQYFNMVVAASQNITAKGTALTSNGDGTLKIATITGATPDVTIGFADEVVNTGGATALVRVRIANASANLASA